MSDKKIDICYPQKDITDISLCVQCGKCKALCPTYQESSIEELGARGRAFLLKKLQKGEISLSKRLYEIIFSCLLCEACNSSCPMQIDITYSIYKSRRNFRHFSKKILILSLILKILSKNYAYTHSILKMLKSLEKIPKIRELNTLNYLTKRLVNLNEPPLYSENFLYRATNPKGRIAIFTGCIVNFIYPSLGRSLIRLINKLRYDVILPKGEVCCGAPLLELGLEEEAFENAQRNMKIFKNLKVESIISICPTCIHFIKNIYKRYTNQSIFNSFEVSQFLSEEASGLFELLEQRDLQKSWKITKYKEAYTIFHDPCHSKYSLNITNEPKNLLRALGINIAEPKNSGCCGSGGIFGFLFRDLSDSILNRTIESYKKSDTIITSCPNCLIQLQTKFSDKKVSHLIDIISGAIET